MVKGSKVLHRPLAEAIVQNSIARNKKNAKELLLGVGYSKSMASHQSKKVLTSKNLQAELELLGFTTMNAKRGSGSILNAPIVYEMVTPDNMIRASSEIFKVNGEYAHDKLDVRTAVIAKITFNKPQ